MDLHQATSQQPRRQPGSKRLPQRPTSISSVAPQPHSGVTATATPLPQSMAPVMIPRALIEEARRNGITDPAQLVAMVQGTWPQSQRGYQYPNSQLQGSLTAANSQQSGLPRTNSTAFSKGPATSAMAKKFSSPSSRVEKPRHERNTYTKKVHVGSKGRLPKPYDDLRKSSKSDNTELKSEYNLVQTGSMTTGRPSRKAEERTTAQNSIRSTDDNLSSRSRVGSVNTKGPTDVSEVSSYSEFTDDDEERDSRPSSRSNPRIVRRNNVRPRGLNRVRSSIKDKDIPRSSIETPRTRPARVGSSRRRRVIQDPDDDFEEPKSIQPFQLDYIMPEQLQSTRKAMGETYWDEYVDCMREFVLSDICEEELRQRERALFQTDDRLRKRIRSMVQKMVSDAVHVE